MKEYLPNCAYCGGERYVDKFDSETGTATVKEYHEKDCEMVIFWKKNYSSSGTN